MRFSLSSGCRISHVHHRFLLTVITTPRSLAALGLFTSGSISLMMVL